MKRIDIRQSKNFVVMTSHRLFSFVIESWSNSSSSFSNVLLYSNDVLWSHGSPDANCRIARVRITWESLCVGWLQLEYNERGMSSRQNSPRRMQKRSQKLLMMMIFSTHRLFSRFSRGSVSNEPWAFRTAVSSNNIQIDWRMDDIQNTVSARCRRENLYE